MHKLTHVETQRMMSVMGEMLDRLNYLSYIPTKWKPSLVDLLIENRCELSGENLQKQWELEEHLHVLKAEGNPKFEDVESQVQKSTRNLCRGLRENPVAVETLYQVCSGIRSNDLMSLVQSLSDLSDLMHQKLLSSVEDENSKSKILETIKNRKKVSEDEVISLQEQLKNEIKAKHEDLSLLESQTLKLKNEIQDIQQHSQNELELIETEMKEALNRAHEEHVSSMTILVEETYAKEQQYKKLLEDHQVEEASYRKKKAKARSDLQTLIEQYDKEMIEKEKAIQEIIVHFEKEVEKKQELELYFDKIDDEISRVEAEEQLIAEERSKEKAKEKIMHDAATAIQKIYRGVLARREFKKKTSKMKKKGKKEKKK